jgi:predicted nucleic-acid-binding protein
VTGLDTNILVRYFAEEDDAQSGAATNVIHSLSPTQQGWVGLTVLLELHWVLTRTYRMKHQAIIYVIDTLLASRDIVVEQRDTVRQALLQFRNHNVDFPDCLIAASAKAAGCERTLTFDRNAARDAGMELLG